MASVLASSSSSRAAALALRSSLRASASRQTPRLLVRPAARRGYASAHDAAAKSSDLPWLIGSIAFTVPAAAYLLYKSPSKKSHSADDSSSSAHHHDGGSETASGDENESSSSSSSDEGGGEPKTKDDSETSSPKDATGGAVPPPSADSASLAQKWDEKKEGQRELNEAARAGETKVATSSSDAPSKKTAAEDPREDPKGGEGEGAARKGGPGE